ncbi:MAG: nucleotidyltransferase family protein, partial [Oscillospiraceae bacterium]|nr:nucleotidyltransferase family protein [Oscillospiraceae bacterium]
MKIGAIICEYNPLHNGHVYHIQETKKHGVTHIIAILSDNFVQRGDVALLNKFDRAKLALHAGADLVLELPVIYSCAPAEIYATGAINLLKQLKIINLLSFGSSVSNPDIFLELAENINFIIKYHFQEIENYIKSGNSYPSAIWKLYQIYYPEQQADLLQNANNLLAIEYIKAMKKLNLNLELSTIPRQEVLHDSLEPSASFASASFIRKAILETQENYFNYIPT